MSDSWDCLCMLLLGHDSWQTGTLVSNSGYILSAAHGLVAAGLDVDDNVTAEFRDGAKLQARILEVGYDSGKWIDYAILQVEPTSEYLVGRRWVPLVAIPLKSLQRTPVRISGFRSAVPEAVTHIDCVVVGSAVLRGPERHASIQLSAQSPADVSGLSGSLIRDSDKGRGFAVQFGQAKDFSAIFAVPIERLRKISRLLSYIIQEQNQLSVLRLESIFGSNRRRGKEVKRWALIAFPESSDKEKIYDLVRRYWVENFESVRRKVESLYWFKRGRSVEFDTYDGRVDVAESSPIDEFMVRDGEVFQPLEDFRAVIDFACSATGPATDSSWKYGYSHFVRIDLGCKADRLLVSDSQDLAIELSPRSGEASARVLLNILGAIAADVMVFYSLPVLEEIFPSTEDRRWFSEAKSQFARDKGLRAWGLEVPGDAEYVPLAALASGSLMAGPNTVVLGSLWREFFDDYLFMNTSQAFDGDGALSSSELKTWVESRIGRVNQLNERSLLSSLEASGLKKGEVGAVGVVVRKPNPRSVARAVAERFGRSEYTHVNIARVFRLSDIRHLGRYAPFVQLVFFRYAGS